MDDGTCRCGLPSCDAEATPAQASQNRPRRDDTPSGGGADGQDAPDAPTARTRDKAHQAAHHAQTQGGQAGIASGLAAIAYAILATRETS